MAPHPEQEALINSNPRLQGYYQSLESRIGYRLLLGGTRYFGFYENDILWPFPISRALRAMENKLAASLDLPSGAYVLVAGCGVAHVATNLITKYGFKVEGIDVIEHHLVKSKRNIARSGLLEHQIAAQKMDYHHLEMFGAETFDGVYTMESFIHAPDPETALARFFQVLRPGGHLSLFEYDHEIHDDSPELVVSFINEIAAMPTNARSHRGVFKQMLEDAGFRYCCA
ncbi:S-adenosyl-L-methionine-dependent methyltransferase [Aspergillus aurantiobrunneus]